MLTCPNDSTALAAVQVEAIPVDQCPTCGGYWLKRGEMEQLGEKHQAHLKPITAGKIGISHSKRKCPEDGTSLREHRFAEHTDIKIDQCPKCQGIWLDKAELSSILSYLDEGPHTEPTLSERAMLFLYQLTLHPPLV